MQLNPLDTEKVFQAVLVELQKRGEFSVQISEIGVRVLHRHGTRHYKTLTSFLQAYVPHLFETPTKAEAATSSQAAT